MTAFERFDPFEQRVSDALTDIAAPRRPDYLDDILRQTARTRQRSRWTFPARWFPIDTVYPGTARVGRAAVTPLVLFMLIALLAALAVITVVGAHNRLPPPFGPARNGEIIFAQDGQLFLANGIAASSRPLPVNAAGQAANPVWSPDGRRFWFAIERGNGIEDLEVADADGSNARLVMAGMSSANVVWAPDSQTIAVRSERAETSELFLAHADGTPAQPVDLGHQVIALDELAFRPLDGRELLVRALLPNSRVALLRVELVTGKVTDLHLPGDQIFGFQQDLTGIAWTLDGNKVVYNQVEPLPGNNPNGRFRVHIVNADGSGDVAVPGPADPAVNEAWPIVSPDGRWILVHRWTWILRGGQPEGWLAVMPVDGGSRATDIGPKIDGGELTALMEVWSPDSSRILVRAENVRTVYSVDPVAGTYVQLPWSTTQLPDWQRLAP
jgi:hypothetical protein